MSYKHTAAVWTLEIPAVTQHVLHALAYHACELCGLAWPSGALLAAECNLGATAVQAALASLRKTGLLRVHAYPQGGRGRATQYIVMPNLAGLSTAPCAKCQWNLKTPRQASGMTSPEPTKGPPRERYRRKPPAAGAERGRLDNPQTIAQVLEGVMPAEKNRPPDG